MNELSGYALSSLREGEIALSRGSGVGLTPILLAAAEVTSPGCVERLEHEYALQSELDAKWAARPVALARDNGRINLVLEDPGGTPLDQLLGRPLDVSQVLRIAIPLSVAIRHVHERGLIHKDIKPANILVEPASGGVWLTGFGIASRLPREHQVAAPPEVIAGTLAYMAPEQTGRMNRSVDSRSDLYALGVTLYEMLVGTRPFTAADPIEWVHCHIARQPMPLDERDARVPAPLSAIVMKLLAKTGEERYQTAAGVEADLRRCLAEWESQGRIEPFSLGGWDVLDRLLIPEKLYGREREIETLLASFDRVVANGTPELVLVSGYSGIGKSSVVNDLHKVMVPPRGLFASGKLDQYMHDIPYATVGQAFQSLVRSLLTQGEGSLGRWRDRLLEALGPNGQLIVDLVPELELVIGKQPPVAGLPPRNAQNRFQAVFGRFVGAFARREHPLVLFLDDLQWLDAATLNLLENLLIQPDLQHLMLIGAYRDNEVNSAHPLMRKLDAIRKADVVVHEITLAPLACDDLGRLIGDSLHCDPESAMPLAQLVHDKTTGNPFFAIQFLSALAEEGLLTFDHGSAQWSWDLNRIRAKGFTDNVVDLMVGKLNRLPVETQEALRLLACMGNSAEFTLMEIASGQSSEVMHAQLWEAIRAGLIFRTEHFYKFLHDRVQEAAYALIPVESRADTHLRIGRLLMEGVPPEQAAENIFDIVNQVNLGSRLVSDWLEKERLAELNLVAGRKAKASTAYGSACIYFAAGTALLAEEGWRRCYDLALALWQERAECELLNSNIEQTEAAIEQLLGNGRSRVDRADGYRWRMIVQLVGGNNLLAVRTAFECLEMFGLEFPEHATQEQLQAEYDDLRRSMGDRTIKSLVDLPLTDNPEIRAVMNILTMLWRSAYHINGTLPQIISCRMVTMTLEHGVTDFTWIGVAGLSIYLGPVFDRFEDGERFARVAAEGVERHGFVAQRPATGIMMGMAVTWTQPIDIVLARNEATIRSAKETGELVDSCYGTEHRLTNLIARGAPLEQMLQEAVAAVEFIRRTNFKHVTDVVLDIQVFIEHLRGYPTEVDESALEAHIVQVGIPFANCCHWILLLCRHFLLGDPEAALAFAEKAKPLLWAVQCHIQSVDYRLYQSLALAAVFPKRAREKQSELRETLADNIRFLQRRAESCPSTFSHKFSLVEAETARIEGREIEAMRLYEKAIQSAADHGFVQYQALANELAAQFYFDRGLAKIAHIYLADARSCYIRWGALGKVALLDQNQARIGQQASSPRLKTIEVPAENLDLAAVIRTSQAVAREIVLEKLIETLMVTAGEYAGADRALLILPQADGQRIEAEANADREGIRVRFRDTPVSAAELPTSVLQHVIGTQDSVILDDARARNAFSADEYLGRKRARSLLCLPLVKQSDLIGVLYLENSLASHVFTPARIGVLKLLSSQAAISLENARLYHNVAERETKIRKIQMELAHVNRVSTMGQLAASIAHEVKQPIGAAVTHAAAAKRWLGRRPPELDEVRVSLERIIEAGRRAADIVDGIRTLTKRAVSRKVQVDINAAIHEVIELTHGEVVKNGGQVKTDLLDGMPSIEGDRVQLQQVILNLVMNAVEAMIGADQGTQEVLISTRRSETDGVLVAVRDSGPGIDPEHLERVFEAFYTTKSSGLGMGLSICRSIIEAHGGRLWASANTPHGSVFQFTLPARREPLSANDT